MTTIQLIIAAFIFFGLFGSAGLMDYIQKRRLIKEYEVDDEIRPNVYTYGKYGTKTNYIILGIGEKETKIKYLYDGTILLISNRDLLRDWDNGSHNARLIAIQKAKDDKILKERLEKFDNIEKERLREKLNKLINKA